MLILKCIKIISTNIQIWDSSGVALVEAVCFLNWGAGTLPLKTEWNHTWNLAYIMRKPCKGQVETTRVGLLVWYQRRRWWAKHDIISVGTNQDSGIRVVSEGSGISVPHYHDVKERLVCIYPKKLLRWGVLIQNNLYY